MSGTGPVNIIFPPRERVKLQGVWTATKEIVVKRKEIGLTPSPFANSVSFVQYIKK